MKVVWSDDAVRALVVLEARLARRYSADKAARIVDQLVRRVDRLEDHPQLGRGVPEFGQWQLRELVDRWNRVIYRLRPDAIEVVTIVPTRIPLNERDAEDHVGRPKTRHGQAQVTKLSGNSVWSVCPLTCCPARTGADQIRFFLMT